MVDAVVGSVAIDQPEQQAPVSIDSKNPFIQLPFNEDTANAIAARAAKAAMGVSGKTGLDKDTIADAMMNGKEQQVRQQAAAQIDLNKTQNAQYITDPEAIKQMFSITDPDTVFEKHYSKEYMDQLDWPKDPDKVARDVPLYYDMTGIPQEYDYVKNHSSNYTAFTELLKNIQENGAYNIGPRQVVGNLIADFASLGAYSEIRLRQAGLTDPGLLLGSNLNEQGLRLYGLATRDFESAKKEAIDTYNGLYRTDPVLANNWIQGIIGQSGSEQFFNDVFTVLNAAGVASGVTKNLLKGSKTALSFDRIVKSTSDMATKIGFPASVPPKVAAPALAGNVSESAVQKVVIDNINRFKNDDNPVEQIKQRLAAIHDIDKTAASSDPSRIGREMSNRIEDIMDSSRQNLTDAVMTESRVNKTPAAVTIESKIRQTQQALADRNRGIDNSVINVSEPMYVPGLNVYAYNVAFGTHDGDLFRDVDEMRSMLKKNGLVVKGDIIETPKTMIRLQKLQAAMKGLETAAAGAETPEGAARAEASINLIRQHIQNLPRHKTGVTFGKAPIYDADIARFEGEGGLTSERQANGWYANKVVFLPPEADFVRDGIITTDYAGSGKTGESLLGKKAVAEHRQALLSSTASTGLPPSRTYLTSYMKAFFGRGRNPADRLSISENRNRVTATHGYSGLLQLLEKEHPLRVLPQRDRSAFGRMLNYLQKTYNEETKSPGIWLDTPSEVDSWFQTYERRSPDPKTIEAYFHYKNVLIADLNMRDLVVGQRKREMNMVENNILYRDKDGNEAQSGFFEGARLHTLPKDWKYLMIAGSTNESTRVYRSRFIPGKIRDKLEAMVREGRAKLIQVADPKSRPLGDLSPRRVEYVLSYGERHQERPLAYGGHVNRTGGGHLMPEWGWFIKQAHVDEGVYEGDKTLMNFMTRAQAQEALPALEKVREAFKRYRSIAEGRLTEDDRRAIERFEGEGGMTGDGLDEAVEANKHTGIPFHKHYDWYFGKNKLLNLNEPLHVVPIDRKIIDMPKEGEALKARHHRTEIDEYGNKHEIHLIDSTRGEGSLLGKAMVSFTQERDAEGIWTMRNKGTQQNPIFAYEPAPYVDPIIAMERGYGRIAKTMYMDDMRDYSREHWLQQAAPFLKTETANTQRDIRDNPVHYFLNPTYKPGTEQIIHWQLESNRKQALEFTGIKNETQTSLREISQKLADGIYRRFGMNAPTMWTIDQLTKTRDPIGFTRNIAFNMVQGFMALPTFFTQAATFGNVMAISPRQSSAAAIATLLYGYSKLNRSPEIMAHLDSLATQLAIPGMTRFKPGQWQEFVKLMESTGFHRTGNEHAFASNTMGDRVVTQGAMKLLDWGRLPFNLGSSFTKIGGFATAYLEHRIQDPFGKIDGPTLQNILSRAALLDHNMSSAFSTKLHTGAFSIPMQFHAYDLRISEMMTGLNLTPAEKARLFITSMSLYGAIGGAATVTLYPVANMISNYTQSRAGYVPGDNPMADLIAQGVPSVLLKYITGMGDYSKGTLVNFSKLGNKGLDPLEEAFTGDKTLAEMFGGVAGNIFYQTLQNTYGFRQWVKNQAIGKGEEFPITIDDVVDSFKSIRFVNDAQRLRYALKYGKWITQNESRLGNIDKAQAITQFITGLSPVWGTDLWMKQHEISSTKQDIASTQRVVEKMLHRAMQARLDNDTDHFHKYLRQAYTTIHAGGIIPPELWDATYNKALDSFSLDQRQRVNYELLVNLRHDIETYRKTQQVK